MEKLLNWCKINKLNISESKWRGSDIVFIDGVGKFLYLKPYDGKIIDEDFSFILDDDEFEILDDGGVDFVLFCFGERFYYSKIKRDKNRYNEIIFKPEFNDFKYLGEIAEDVFMDYVHLGVHSEYELMNGSGNCELWVKKAKFLKCSALGICDKNTLAGTMSFNTYCDKYGIRGITGETISVAVNYDASADNQELFDLKLFPKNYEGWKNLLAINSEINVKHAKFIPENRLLELGSGIYAVIPKESEFNYKSGDKAYCKNLLKKYKSAFEGVYYQLDTCDYKSDQLFRKHLADLDFYITNFRAILPPILINDAYYLDKEESGLKAMLNKVDGVVNAESDSQYFKSLQDTLEAYAEWSHVEPLFQAILDGLNNAVKLVSNIEFKLTAGERKIPKFECRDVVSKFYKEVNRGWEERIAGKVDDEKKYFERLETECAVIVPNDLCDYFMILWDIMRWCRENGINTGAGRGSVCGSLVAYLLRITDVNPLEYGLLFERFLNETRVSGERAKSADSMPDIDVDFPTEYRDCVKEYIKVKYGYDYTCAIGTYTRMKLKTCIKDFGKVKGLPFDLTNKLTKDIDDQIEYTCHLSASMYETTLALKDYVDSQIGAVLNEQF